jgi:hypothetical protein
MALTGHSVGIGDAVVSVAVVRTEVERTVGAACAEGSSIDADAKAASVVMLAKE